MDSRGRNYDPMDRLLYRMRHNAGYYKRCPQCGRIYRSEQEYRQETRRELFTSVTYGLCSCGYDLEQ